MPDRYRPTQDEKRSGIASDFNEEGPLDRLLKDLWRIAGDSVDDMVTLAKRVGEEIAKIPGAIVGHGGNMWGDETLEEAVNRTREEILQSGEPLGQVTEAQGPMKPEGPEHSSYTPPGRERGGEIDARRTRPGEQGAQPVRQSAEPARQGAQPEGQTALTAGAQEAPPVEGRTALTQEPSAVQEEPTVQNWNGVEYYDSKRLNKTITTDNLYSLSRDEKQALFHEIYGDGIDISTQEKWIPQELRMMGKFRAMLD